MVHFQVLSNFICNWKQTNLLAENSCNSVQKSVAKLATIIAIESFDEWINRILEMSVVRLRMCLIEPTCDTTGEKSRQLIARCRHTARRRTCPSDQREWSSAGADGASDGIEY